jgi:hypothetical protein
MRRTLVACALATVLASAIDTDDDSLESLGITVDTPSRLSTELTTDEVPAFTPLYTLADNNFSDFVSTSPIVLVELWVWSAELSSEQELHFTDNSCLAVLQLRAMVLCL